MANVLAAGDDSRTLTVSLWALRRGTSAVGIPDLLSSFKWTRSKPEQLLSETLFRLQDIESRLNRALGPCELLRIAIIIGRKPLLSVR